MHTLTSNDNSNNNNNNNNPERNFIKVKSQLIRRRCISTRMPLQTKQTVIIYYNCKLLLIATATTDET